MLAAVPHYWYIHEYGKEDHGLAFQYSDKFSQWLMRTLSAGFILNSQTVQKKFERKGMPSQVVYYLTTVPHSVNSISKHSAFTYILIGRFQKEKNQLLAVQAFALLRRKSGGSMRLRLVGGGSKSYKESVRNLAKEEGLSSEVDIIDFTEQPYEEFRKAHVALDVFQTEGSFWPSNY